MKQILFKSNYSTPVDNNATRNAFMVGQAKRSGFVANMVAGDANMVTGEASYKSFKSFFQNL